jgi:hypothetical protein
MTVAELIKALQEMPQDMEVVVEQAIPVMEGGGYDDVIATDVESGDAYIQNGYGKGNLIKCVRIS